MVWYQKYASKEYFKSHYKVDIGKMHQNDGIFILSDFLIMLGDNRSIDLK